MEHLSEILHSLVFYLHVQIVGQNEILKTLLL